MSPLQQTQPADRASASNRREGDTIPLIEETARIEKRSTTATTRIHITVSEHDEAIEALLLRQDATIERVTIGTPIDTPPPTRREGDTIVVPILEERLVVEKRLFLKEELRIRIGETRHTATQAIRLKREHAEIVRDDLDPSTTEGIHP
jgi:stress response protein YsnF